MIFIELNLSFHLLLRLPEALGYVDTKERNFGQRPLFNGLLLASRACRLKSRWHGMP